jgi:hypothetical protein
MLPVPVTLRRVKSPRSSLKVTPSTVIDAAAAGAVIKKKMNAQIFI